MSKPDKLEQAHKAIQRQTRKARNNIESRTWSANETFVEMMESDTPITVEGLEKMIQKRPGQYERFRGYVESFWKQKDSIP